MTPLSKEILVTVRAEGLRDLRDSLIGFQDLAKIVRMDTSAPGDVSLAPLLYLEGALSREAGKVSAWINEYEQQSLPF